MRTPAWYPDELETHPRTEFGTFSWLLEPMLARVGFVIEAVETSDNRIFTAHTRVERP